MNLLAIIVDIFFGGVPFYTVNLRSMPVTRYIGKISDDATKPKR